MTDQIVLFGAGAAGRYALRYLRSKGIEPVAFADSDMHKWATEIEGILVASPESCASTFPSASWVATAMQHNFAVEIRERIKGLGVPSIPLWKCLNVCHDLPPVSVRGSVFSIMGDGETYREWNDQMKFRINPDYEAQIPPTPASETYFPEFIKKLPQEHFLDIGAACGDTAEAFMERWPEYGHITALEPDQKNFDKLRELWTKGVYSFRYAVGDHEGPVRFKSNGDFSSHVSNDGDDVVCGVRIDDLMLPTPPTYIKFDIEGSEPKALWGARKTLLKHRPVLAVCAYHESDHLWQLPLLVHALQPDYRAYLRRYAEGAYELVWYFIPPERAICDMR